LWSERSERRQGKRRESQGAALQEFPAATEQILLPNINDV
jgi:hypothetical protein